MYNIGNLKGLIVRITLLLTVISFVGIGPYEYAVQPTTSEWVRFDNPVQQTNNFYYRSLVKALQQREYWDYPRFSSEEFLLEKNNLEFTSFKSQNKLTFCINNPLDAQFLKRINLHGTDNFYHTFPG